MSFTEPDRPKGVKDEVKSLQLEQESRPLTYHHHLDLAEDILSDAGVGARVGGVGGAD